MGITVSGRKMTITNSLRSYAEEKIGNSLKILDFEPASVEVVLYKEKNPANPLPAICEVTVYVKGSIVRVEESEEEMYAAIDVAAAKVMRQLRKYKTRVVDKKLRAASETAHAGGELDLDALMDELTDDEIVRVKEIEFTPMTEEEALAQIDLIGHNFFVYTDRDTNLVCVLYRRSDGAYGMLKQKD